LLGDILADWIPLLSIASAAIAVGALFVERVSRRAAIRARNASLSVSEAWLGAITDLGPALTALTTDADGSAVQAWLDRKQRPNDRQLARLLAAHYAYTLISNAENSTKLAAEWLIAEPTEDGNSPLGLIRAGRLDAVVRAATRQVSAS
jgi:hypothetical protein